MPAIHPVLDNKRLSAGESEGKGQSLGSESLTRKIAADRDKVALFAIFVLGVVIASVIVKVRGQVRFSEAIELEHSGVSVSIPDKKPWYSIGQWRYEKNGFSLISSMRANQQAMSSIKWRYELIPIPSSDEYLSQRAEHFKSDISNHGQKKLGSLSMDWAEVRIGGGYGNVLMGVVQLGDGRSLTLEVGQAAGYYDIARNLFDASAKSLKFESNGLLASGIAAVEAFNLQGLSETVYGRSRQKYFLIENTDREIRGFLVDGFGEKTDEADIRRIIATNVYYFQRSAGTGSEQSFFEIDESGGPFKWAVMSDNSRIAGKTKTVIERYPEGNVSIDGSTVTGERFFVPGKAAIAEILLEPFLSEFIRADSKEMILDLILGSGPIIQALITNIDSESVKVQFLDESRAPQIIHFDQYLEIDQIDILSEPAYSATRATRNEVLANFVEWKEEIIKVEQYLAEKQK